MAVENSRLGGRRSFELRGLRRFSFGKWGQAKRHPSVPAAEAIRQLAPNVAVLDVVMPGLNKLEVLSATAAEGGITKIVFLTAFATDEHPGGIANGAQSIVVKAAAPDSLVECVRAVAGGKQ